MATPLFFLRILEEQIRMVQHVTTKLRRVRELPRVLPAAAKFEVVVNDG
jgi:hypothetical protein